MARLSKNFEKTMRDVIRRWGTAALNQIISRRSGAAVADMANISLMRLRNKVSCIAEASAAWLLKVTKPVPLRSVFRPMNRSLKTPNMLRQQASPSKAVISTNAANTMPMWQQNQTSREHIEPWYRSCRGSNRARHDSDKLIRLLGSCRRPLAPPLRSLPSMSPSSPPPALLPPPPSPLPPSASSSSKLLSPGSVLMTCGSTRSR